MYTWMYNTGRSVFADSLFHATANVSWQVYPNSGSHFDPQIIGLLTAFVSLIVVVIFGRRALVFDR